MTKHVFLDRDGVINQDSDLYIKSPDEWSAIPSSLEAIAKLTAADYNIMVITNQSGVGRGLYNEATLASIHQKMIETIEKHQGKITGIYYCPHTPEDHCSCRKPQSGMLLQAIREHNISTEGTYMVGDAMRDIQAARAAEVLPALVLTGKGLGTQARHSHEINEVPIFATLLDFVNHLTEQ